jgi:GT2 family glycosyltransferase
LPAIDLIVPTVEGREDSLARCLDSFPDLNHIVIKGQETCGSGWMEGIKRSGADYLVLCCDDIEADPDCDLGACVAAVDDGYLPAPVIHRPDGSVESAGGDIKAAGHLLANVQADWTPVDFSPLPFASRAQIRKIRMIPAHYMTDVFFSHKGRQLGYETVLRHDYKLIHHHAMTGRRQPTGEDRNLYAEGIKNEA